MLMASVAGAAALMCLGSMLFYTGGRFIAPLDDVYIALAYGRELIHGLPYRFNASDPPSTGATSILLVILASPLTLLEGNEWVPVVGLLVLNCILFWLTCIQLHAIAIRLMPASIARFAVLAVLTSGPVVWGMFCGLDTALASFLVASLWRTWSEIPEGGAGSARGWIVPGIAAAALALARPEGAIMCFVAALFTFAVLAWRKKRARACTALLLGSAAVAIALVSPLVVTRSLMPSSGWAKTGWGSPVIPPTVPLGDSARFLVDSLKGIWMGTYPAEAAVGVSGSAQAENEVIYCFPPGALLLAIMGMVPLSLAAPLRALGAALWLTAWLVVAAVLPTGWHHHRYLLPVFPVFIVLAFSGIASIGGRTRSPWRRQMASVLIGTWFLFTLPGLFRYVQFYGHGAENYLWHHRLMAEQLEEMPQPGAVAATDVGILKYFTSRRIVDLKALTAPWLAPASSRGWGSIYDEFKKLPPDARPRFAALHAARPDVDAELPLRAGVLRPVLVLGHPRITSDFVLYECDWGNPGRSPAMPGWQLVDELDCGNAPSEDEHGYRGRMASRDVAPYSTIQIRDDSAAGTPVGDGGYVLSLGEDFTVRAKTGVPLIMMMRTYAPRSTLLNVSMNGEPGMRVPVAAQPAAFQTILLYQCDGSGVREVNDLRVRCEWPQGQHYSSFHYWFLQPQHSGN